MILFDGVCNLCSRSVQFILKRDKRGRFRFASLQSPVGQALLQQAGLPADHIDTFVLIENSNLPILSTGVTAGTPPSAIKVYTRSSGALRVLRLLGGAWALLYIFWIIPRPIRDIVYDWVARHRYRWFGKQDSCWLPRPEWKDRFLD